MSVSAGRPAIGIDIGGTKIAGGLVSPDGETSAIRRVPTPVDDSAQLRGAVVEMVRQLAQLAPSAGVGIGVAGWVTADRGTVRYAPHLPWRDEPVRQAVSREVGLPVVVENDANAAAWGEYRFGAGAYAADPGSAASTVMVTVGTGIGGGIVAGGELVRGAHGHAGEPGHQRVVPDGHPCRCGRRGCWEQYASGQALVRFARAGAAERPADAGELLKAAGAAEAVTGPMVTAAARAGDRVALAAFDEVGRWLGSGLADLVQLLDPGLLVIGGGVAESGELLFEPLAASYRRELADRGSLPVAEVRLARLGNIAGLAGVADLARKAVEESDGR